VTRSELEHAIRAACDITHDHEVYVFGSQAILGEFPDAPPRIRVSAEADISPKNRLDRIEYLNAIGEDSPFHRAHGFYVHGLPIDEAATLPVNWRERTVRIKTDATRGNVGLCVEAHDLAASKLFAFRDKDRDFVRVLLAERLIGPRKLIARIRLLPVEEETRLRLVRWVDLTAKELRED
jgi:hypothetical protein